MTQEGISVAGHNVEITSGVPAKVIDDGARAIKLPEAAATVVAGYGRSKSEGLSVVAPSMGAPESIRVEPAEETSFGTPFAAMSEQPDIPEASANPELPTLEPVAPNVVTELPDPSLVSPLVSGETNINENQKNILQENLKSPFDDNSMSAVPDNHTFEKTGTPSDPYSLGGPLPVAPIIEETEELEQKLKHAAEKIQEGYSAIMAVILDVYKTNKKLQAEVIDLNAHVAETLKLVGDVAKGVSAETQTTPEPQLPITPNFGIPDFLSQQPLTSPSETDGGVNSGLEGPVRQIGPIQ